VSIFVASLPENFAQQQTICSGTACAFWQPTPATVQALHALHLSFSSYATFSVLLRVVSTLLCIGVALVIVRHKSDDWMALLVALWLVIVGAVCSTFTVGLGHSLWRLPSLALFFLCFSLLFLVFCLFPDGRLLPRWMRWLLVGWVVLNVFDFFPEISTLSPPFVLIWYGSMSSCAVAQIYRYRRIATPLQRQQTKWVIFALAVVSAMDLGLFSLYFIFPSFLLPGSLYKVASVPLYIFIAQLFPLSIGLAILRYRLWDIDILINRTLVYLTLTAALALIYTSGIIVLQYLVGGIINQNNGVTIVVSTLVVAALFQPLRHRIQATIDRRFYRRKYDAAKTLAAFGATLRNEVDLNDLSRRLVAVVEETMQPAHVSLWLLKTQYEGKSRNHGTEYPHAEGAV
jgi:hypothetical protein